MSDIHEELFCADRDSFALAVNAKPFNLFFYKTPHTLEYVMGPGYFNSVIECSLRKDDRIEVVANSMGVSEHATLAVGKIINASGIKSVEVRLLFCNK
jgi:hypothetical protein